MSAQGFIGLSIFLIIVIAFYWKLGAYRAAAVYSPLIMLALSWMTGVLVILLLNDMLEVIKLGPFFFLALWIVAPSKEHPKEVETIRKTT